MADRVLGALNSQIAPWRLETGIHHGLTPIHEADLPALDCQVRQAGRCALLLILYYGSAPHQGRLSPSRRRFDSLNVDHCACVRRAYGYIHPLTLLGSCCRHVCRDSTTDNSGTLQYSEVAGNLTALDLNHNAEPFLVIGMRGTAQSGLWPLSGVMI